MLVAGNLEQSIRVEGDLSADLGAYESELLAGMLPELRRMGRLAILAARGRSAERAHNLIGFLRGVSSFAWNIQQSQSAHSLPQPSMAPLPLIFGRLTTEQQDAFTRRITPPKYPGILLGVYVEFGDPDPDSGDVGLVRFSAHNQTPGYNIGPSAWLGAKEHSVEGNIVAADLIYGTGINDALGVKEGGNMGAPQLGSIGLALEEQFPARRR